MKISVMSFADGRLMKAIESDPQNARAYANRGLTRLFLGQETDAAKDFEQCLTLDNKLAQSLAKRIKELKLRLASGTDIN